MKDNALFVSEGVELEDDATSHDDEGVVVVSFNYLFEESEELFSGLLVSMLLSRNMVHGSSANDSSDRNVVVKTDPTTASCFVQAFALESGRSVIRSLRMFVGSTPVPLGDNLFIKNVEIKPNKFMWEVIVTFA